MKKFFLNMMALAALLCIGFGAKAQSWPANYQGVMLQGFYWDAYKTGGGYGTTKWTDLTNQADELSKYFSLIWVPNSARANGEGGGGNGYMPIYWFTNHNCAYGTEAQLKAMLAAFKAKGVGLIEDVVINHRVGATNWYDFPKETWNGKTYHLTNGAICSTDEMWKSGGQGCPYTRGNADEGEDFDGARDLDHTNSDVQANCKDYVKFLMTDLGYVGCRYDMVKGYSGYYTGMYNAYAGVKFSVGEFFDGNYDKVARWIDQTAEYGNGAGKSAAFDFPSKYAINEAFGSNDMTKLAWTNPSGQQKPAGMIHYGYTQFAVTFVDNHDTFRDGSKFPSDPNIMAANAFILFSPGTPCVFWPHYYANKNAMQKLIDTRNSLGIHNLSEVNVLRCTNNCYAAEIIGTKGKAVVKIGSDTSFSPGNGYQIVATGTNYCVWSTNSGGQTPTNPGGNPGGNTGDGFNIYFDNSSSNWATPTVHYWGAGGESSWPGVAMTKFKDNVWVYKVPAGTTGLVFNAGDGDNTKTSDFTAQANHIYTTSGDQGVYSGATDNPGGGNQGGNTGNPFNIFFDNTSSNWATPTVHYWGAGGESQWPGVAMTKFKDNVWVYKVPAGTTGLVFNAGDGDATKTGDFTAQPNHVYTTSGDQGVYADAPADNPGGGNDNPGGGSTGDYPETLYLIGNINGENWNTATTAAASHKNGVYVWAPVQFDDAGDGNAYFSFITLTGADWDAVNGGDRYGSDAFAVSESENKALAKDTEDTITLYPAFVSAMGASSWKVVPGTYMVTADLGRMKVKISDVPAGVDGIEGDDEAPVFYFNLQGVRVENPDHGLYIRVQGKKAEKVIL